MAPRRNIYPIQSYMHGAPLPTLAHQGAHKEIHTLSLGRAGARSRFGARLLLVILLAFGLGLSLVGLRLQVNSTGYQLAELRRHVEELQATNERLRLEVKRQEAPDRLERQAQQMGLVLPSESQVAWLPENGVYLAQGGENSNGGSPSGLAAAAEPGSVPGKLSAGLEAVLLALDRLVEVHRVEASEAPNQSGAR